MTFTTLTFLLFLPLVFALYWTLRRRGPQNALLVLASFVFYGWWDWRFCFLMMTSACVDFGVGLLLWRAVGPGRRRLLLLCSLVANLGLLGFFKYWNFFADGFAQLCARVGWPVHPLELQLVLPVGISFYTFQTLSYTIDVYRKKLAPTKNFLDYLAYVTFFPQLVAGPIERATRLLPQFQRERRFGEPRASDGGRQVLWGFFKKLVVADRLATFVDGVYAAPDAAPGPLVAAATVAFALQIYCDFSAYSDIAIGTGRLFGFDLMRNFAYPYFSRSVAEFWRRWHISLSTWFRDYVYVPLGGNRHGSLRQARNIMVTFVLSGLWHGASWNFVIWGAIMGCGVLPVAFGRAGPRREPSTTPGGEGRLPAPRALLAMLLTFTVACFGWVFFRAHGLPAATGAFEAMLRDALSPAAWSALFDALSEKDGRNALLVGVLIVLIEWVQRRRSHALALENLSRPARWILLTAVLWVTLLTGPKGETRFIYFQF